MGLGSQKDKLAIKDQLGKPPQELTVGVWEYYEDVWCEEGATIISTTNIAGDSLIWNHTQFGTWNSYKWGGTVQSSFVLGHSLAGLLGTSKLGSLASSAVPIRIINPSNIFRERFRDDDFEDANTTATWDTTNHLAYFGDAEVLQTEIFALSTTNYSTAKVILTGSAISNLTLELRFDGSNWESVTNNVTFNSSYADDAGIEFRATAGTVHSNKFALAFPVSFAGTTIELLKVEYS